jgi:tRNA pseudouridine55 synthase
MPSVHQKKKRIPVHGVLLLDKARDISSNDALIAVKRLLNAEKAGHTGTLDPFATGLLPLCFGEATKFAQDLLDADKTYEALLHLGVTTTSADSEGDVLERQSVDIQREQIEVLLPEFSGEQTQIPPMYSALKRDGKPLYEYARAGITLEREARAITIHELKILDYQAPFLRLHVCCSKGTYIRTLGEDIGRALGCGAHLSELRRIAVANLQVSEAITYTALSEEAENNRTQHLKPVDALITNCPKIILNEQLATRFMHGQRLALGKEGVALPVEQGRVRVYGEGAQLLGTGQIKEFAVLAPERLVNLFPSL